MEKQKREVTIQESGLIERRSSSRTLAIVLIAVGVLFLLINAGIFSFNDIGSFFGSIGAFFGRLGGSIGHIFGGLGGLIGRFWPVLLILIGALLLLRRKPSVEA